MCRARRPICILLATVLVVFLAVLMVSIIIPGLTDGFFGSGDEAGGCFDQICLTRQVFHGRAELSLNRSELF